MNPMRKIRRITWGLVFPLFMVLAVTVPANAVSSSSPDDDDEELIPGPAQLSCLDEEGREAVVIVTEDQLYRIEGDDDEDDGDDDRDDDGDDDEEDDQECEECEAELEDGVWELEGCWEEAGGAASVSSTRTPIAAGAGYALFQNHPNPFNPATLIRFSLPERAHVTLRVYDLLGREVATLVDGENPAGIYSANFDARGLASGLYIYRLTAGKFIEARKMSLTK